MSDHTGCQHAGHNKGGHTSAYGMQSTWMGFGNMQQTEESV